MGQVKYHFNDERLNSRAEMCFSEVLQNPLKDFPEVFKKSADLEGFYRLLNNSEVFLDELQKTIVEDTQARIFASNLQKRDILVLHDTTEICPPKANSIPAFKKDGKFSKGICWQCFT